MTRRSVSSALERGEAQAATRPRRIFWFGAHKLLVVTELERLRKLGYEVFNPPYLTHALDQSVHSHWNSKQPSTLPAPIFDRLSKYNFFYNTIDPSIGAILNEYFDIVIVTIVARWATEIMRVFHGPCIFRTYGMERLSSVDFEQIRGGRELVESRANFHFCPHSNETLEGEPDWLQARACVIPYCVSPDTFDWCGRWNEVAEHDGNILVSAPNIAGNIYPLGHYHFLKEYFYQKHFRFCGVQIVPIEDDQVVQTLDRTAQMQMFASSSGYLYTYRYSHVCYLPPIEMMILGAPVAYFKGCLLARYIGEGAPGEAASIPDAHRICERFRAADSTFIAEVRATQRAVIDRYDPQHVWPIFDKEMVRLIESSDPAFPSNVASTITPDDMRDFVDDYVSFASASEPSLDQAESCIERFAVTVAGKSPEQTERRALAARLKAEGGDTILATLLGMNPHRDKLLSTIGAECDGTVTLDGKRRNFVLSGGLSGGPASVGRWSSRDGMRCRTSRRGEQGLLMYGPNIWLVPGRYRLTVKARQFPVVLRAGTVDVFVDGQPIFARELRSLLPGFREVCGEFEILGAHDRVEFRIFADGSASLELASLTVEPVA